MGSFAIRGHEFVFDGTPLRVLSGAVHYFRVPPACWRDRLLKLRACGLNAVETYVPWNAHEPRPGQVTFDGWLDLVGFIRLAAELELRVIVRPGPYICSEWDLGGLPAWLLADPGMRLRCSYPPYLEAVDRWFDVLLARLAPLQVTRDGPVVAMQIENEYGSYGNDKTYLKHLLAGMRARGIDVLLFTADGGQDSMLEGGTLLDVLKAVNFGRDAVGQLAALRRHQPQGPLFCGEFWSGWFDHWGEAHNRRSAEEAAAELDAMLAAGASVNLYMFHGGTSFGFWPGANHTGTEYQPDVNSYDFDALLDEAGAPTAKFHACRAAIARHVPVPPLQLPPPVPRRAYGPVRLGLRAGLFESLPVLATQVDSPLPEPMERLGQAHGFILYRTTVNGPREAAPLVVEEVHDRAQLFVDGEVRAVLERNRPAEVMLRFGPGPHRLELLVENMGRVNFGPQLHDRKGITAGVRLGLQWLFGWQIFPLPLTDLSSLQFIVAEAARTGPAFFRGLLQVDEPADTFLALPGWTKGVCFLNGFNLGRYWERGPQRTLYVPAPLLRPGYNDLVVFELHDAGDGTVEFRAEPDLG